MPIKNERWILETTIPQLKKFADEILCLDAGSTDGTIEYLKSMGVEVRQQKEQKINFSAWRKEVLEWGREHGGTHFIWLDADEAFTTNFLGTKNGGIPFRERLARMKPGEKLALQWLCLWKNPRVYRNDKSVWTNLYKDFIVCDDSAISFDNTLLHEGRTPGPNTNITGSKTWTKIPLEEGGVLHFQFVPFERFQAKQAYQRCREYVMDTGSPWRINNKYSQTLDTPSARTLPIPPAWLDGITGLDSVKNAETGWYIDAVFAFFNEKGEKGIAYFEPLQIWNVPEFRERFVKEMGREPKPRTAPAILVKLNSLKNKIIRKS